MSLTRLIVTSVVIILGVYDLCVVVFSGNIDASVSRYWGALATYPGIVFTIGYICGHVFGWMTPTIPAVKREQLLRLKKQFDDLASLPENGNPISCSRMHFREWSEKIEGIAGK